MAGRSKFMIGSVAVAMALLVVAGCRSSTKQTAGEEPVGVETVGIDTCFKCHADGSLGKFPSMIGNSATPNVGWLYSAHGNYEARDANVQPIDLGVYNDGFPFYAFSEWNDTCQTCHDPLGDGKKFSAIYALYGSGIGQVNRPVIGCESCHGPGGNHFGLGPIPYPKPDPSRCGQCHNETFPADHLQFHPEGANIYEDYQTSPHAKSINEHTLVAGSTTDVTAKCSRCHTDEGVKLYEEGVPRTASYDEITTFFGDKPKPDVTNASPVGCRTCHDVHNQGKKFLAAATTTSTGNQSEQFNTCTTCHQLNKTDGTVLTDAYHDPSVNSFASLDEVITDTHAAVPGDTRLNSGASKVALFFVNKGDDRSCTGCHNPHNADTTINKQYAQSGHGDATADPWTHYDWKLVSRRSCQQCHTSTGFKNFADALRAGTTYNPANNNFYGLLAGTSGNTGQLETIYCWGCHTDNKGGLRNPGPITAPYNDMSNNPISFPDVSGSNVCMACHTGQQSGGTVYNTVGNFSNLSFINSHYLTGGATVFRASGYAYPTRDYSNVSFYAHDKVGSADASGTGTNGPCAGCHMQTVEPHLFLPVTKDETTGAITAITSTACAVCHVPGGPFEMTVDELEQEKTRFGSSLEALRDQLELRGYYFSPAYPYFYQLRYKTGTVSATNESAVVTGSGTTWTGAGIVVGGASPDQFKVNLDGIYYSVASVDSDTQITFTAPYAGSTVTGAMYSIIKNGSANAMKNWLTQSGPAPFATPDTDTTGATSGKNNMGAAFNYNLLLHDPGAFTHNRFYIKRLIYDSIDWLDDDNLNDSVQATLNALDLTEHPYQADAVAYILSATGGRP